MLKLLHRHVWQALPRDFRRRLLFTLTAAAAPRPDRPPPAASDRRAVIAGSLNTASGLGESARQCMAALRDGGFSVSGVDLTAVFRQEQDFAFASAAAETDRADGQDQGEDAAAGALIVHVNAPYMPLALSAVGRRGVRGRRVIGYWAWELPVAPPDWRRGLPFVHEAWVPSRFCADAVAAAGDVRVRVLPHPIERRAPAPPAERRWARPDGAFVVTTIFNMASGFSRKNPVAAVVAFRRAFGDDPSVRLLVKLVNPQVFPAGAQALQDACAGAGNIEIIDAVLSPAQLARLYVDSDALISLHRSEGFGLTVAEAMSHGVVAVATDWSGSRDFLTADTGAPVPYRLIPAFDPQGVYDHPDQSWADADTDAAAAVLRRLLDQPDHRRGLGAQARAYVDKELSPARYAERVRAFLRASL